MNIALEVSYELEDMLLHIRPFHKTLLIDLAYLVSALSGVHSHAV